MVPVYVPITLMLMFSSYVKQSFSSVCDKKDTSSLYLDVAMDMISKAKENIPFCTNVISYPIDCEEVQRQGHTQSGLYRVWPKSRVMEDKPLDVYCDMLKDGGGWTVIQRRGNFESPKDYFFRDWSDYKKGFGDNENDFWLGNDNIFALTNQRIYSVRFDLVDVSGESRYAKYGYFWIDDETHNYTLHIKEYSGDAGDSMTTAHNNRQFSTKDHDNDQHEGNCAQKYKGAWWYGACHHSNLNGLYHKGKHSSHADGVNWKAFRFHNESLETTEIKIRPKNAKISPKNVQEVKLDLDISNKNTKISPEAFQEVSLDLDASNKNAKISPQDPEEVALT